MDADVVIVGAGLAGASAAAELSERGCSVVILEARDRVGGRGLCRPFGGTGDRVDFGGSWITPWQHRIRALCAEHGIELRPRAPVVERRWFRDDAVHLDGPADAGELGRHDAAIARIAADARGDHDRFGDVSMTAYLEALDAPTATRDLVRAWWALSGSADPERVPVSELLASCAHGDGTPDGMCEAWADTLAGGVTELVRRMISAAGADLRLSSPVRSVTRRSDSLVVHCDNLSLTCRGAIVATGINPLRHIDVPLRPEQRDAVDAGNAGRAVKVWAQLEGVPTGVLATGGGSGIEWMLTERDGPDGTTMAVGFGVAAPPFDVEAATRAAVARFFPEAALLAIDRHDWIADPWSRGTWVSVPLGADGAFASSTWEPDGALAFATSDVAPDDAGWFEGAIHSGELAARTLYEGREAGASPRSAG